MRFGEFLVHSNVVKEHDVLRALAEQQRRRPFIPQLMIEVECLSGKQALRLHGLADDRRTDFLTVVQQEGFITEQQAELIYDTWKRSAPRLGELMVELGMISPATQAEKLAEHEALRQAFPAT